MFGHVQISKHRNYHRQEDRYQGTLGGNLCEAEEAQPMKLSRIRDALAKFERVPSYTLTCKASESEFDDIISTLESDGYMVSKTNQDYIYPLITAIKHSSDHCIQSSVSRSTAPPTPMKMCCPFELDGSTKLLRESIEWLQK